MLRALRKVSRWERWRSSRFLGFVLDKTLQPSERREDGRGRAEISWHRLGGEVAFDIAELLGPTLVVHPEGLGAARRGNLVEARFDHRELRTFGKLRPAELDEA